MFRNWKLLSAVIAIAFMIPGICLAHKKPQNHYHLHDHPRTEEYYEGMGEEVHQYLAHGDGTAHTHDHIYHRHAGHGSNWQGIIHFTSNGLYPPHGPWHKHEYTHTHAAQTRTGADQQTVEVPANTYLVLNPDGTIEQIDAVPQSQQVVEPPANTFLVLPPDPTRHTQIDPKSVPKHEGTDPSVRQPALSTPQQPVNPPQIPVTPQQPEKGDSAAEEDESGNIEKTLPLVMRYTHTFPEGIAFQHIPLDTKYNHVDAFYPDLGDSAHKLIASRGASGWAYLSRNKHHADAIWLGIGFISIMNEETELDIEGTFGGWTGKSNLTYVNLYLRSGGLTLLGVPLKSQSLQKVGDFYTFFEGVTSVKGINPDYELPDDTNQIGITDDWFIELDNETEIEPTAAYLIAAEDSDERSLWGTPWFYEPASAAPQIQRYYKMATMWGKLKAR